MRIVLPGGWIRSTRPACTTTASPPPSTNTTTSRHSWLSSLRRTSGQDFRGKESLERTQNCQTTRRRFLIRLPWLSLSSGFGARSRPEAVSVACVSAAALSTCLEATGRPTMAAAATANLDDNLRKLCACNRVAAAETSMQQAGTRARVLQTHAGCSPPALVPHWFVQARRTGGA